MNPMRMNKVIKIVLVLMVLSVTVSQAECDSAAFVEEVNAAWVATNYPLIKIAITNRLSECTNDLLALGLQFEYFRSAEVDYLSAKAAAQAFVLAVSNRVPDEVIEERDIMGLPIVIARQATPTNLPPVSGQVRTPEQVDYMHRTYPDAFPYISLYQILAGRVKLEEEGSFIWGVGFVDPEE
jgi:hypothetical protein